MSLDHKIIAHISKYSIHQTAIADRTQSWDFRKLLKTETCAILIEPDKVLGRLRKIINVASERTKAPSNEMTFLLSQSKTLGKKTETRGHALRALSSEWESKETCAANLIWRYGHGMTKAFVAIDRMWRVISETWQGPATARSLD